MFFLFCIVNTAFIQRGDQKIPQEEFCKGVKNYFNSPESSHDLSILEKCTINFDECPEKENFSNMLTNFVWTLMKTEQFCAKEYEEAAEKRQKLSKIVFSAISGKDALNENFKLIDPETVPYVAKIIEDLTADLTENFTKTFHTVSDNLSEKFQPVVWYARVFGWGFTIIMTLGVIACTTYCIAKQI